MTYPGNSTKFTKRDYSHLSDHQVINLHEQMVQQYSRKSIDPSDLQDIELELRNRGIEY